MTLYFLPHSSQAEWLSEWMDTFQTPTPAYMGITLLKQSKCCIFFPPSKHTQCKALFSCWAFVLSYRSNCHLTHRTNFRPARVVQEGPTNARLLGGLRQNPHWGPHGSPACILIALGHCHWFWGVKNQPGQVGPRIGVGPLLVASLAFPWYQQPSTWMFHPSRKRWCPWQTLYSSIHVWWVRFLSETHCWEVIKIWIVSFVDS